MNLKPTADGSHTLVSDAFGATYHSLNGAVAETQHVFVEKGLIRKSNESSSITLLEIGLGTGLNALMSFLWMEGRPTQKLHYVAYEAFPISTEVAEKLNYPELLEEKYGYEKEKSKAILQKIHHCKSGEIVAISENITFEKRLQRFETIAEHEVYDVVYFDAFSPEIQPELWTASFLLKVANAMSEGAILSTYCAKGQVRRNLQECGLQVERTPGPPGKREMLVATKLL